MNETPRVSTISAPIDPGGTSTAPRKPGPSSTPAPSSTSIGGSRTRSATTRQTSPAPSITDTVRIASCASTRRFSNSRRTLARAAAIDYQCGVLVFLLLGWTPLPLLLALGLALYLSVVELRQMREHYLWWIWWLLLVFMTHFVGYLILRAY